MSMFGMLPVIEKTLQPVGNSFYRSLLADRNVLNQTLTFSKEFFELVQTDQIQHECLSTKVLTWSIFKFSEKFDPPRHQSNFQGWFSDLKAPYSRLVWCHHTFV